MFPICFVSRLGGNMDWMYRTGKPDTEEYLLGKSVDKMVSEAAANTEEGTVLKSLNLCRSIMFWVSGVCVCAHMWVCVLLGGHILSTSSKSVWIYRIVWHWHSKSELKLNLCWLWLNFKPSLSVNMADILLSFSLTFKKCWKENRFLLIYEEK